MNNINGTGDINEPVFTDSTIIHDANDEYRKARINYYRKVIRKQDQELIKKLNKIPDNWDDYEENSCGIIKIKEDVKNRLTDIKQNKSWEMRYESLFLHHIVTVEELLIDCFNFRNIDDERLQDGIESVNSIIVEIGSDCFNFKHLLLSLAKRSVSDLYYLMNAYYIFFKRKSFNIERDFHDFCEDALSIINDHKRLNEIQDIITDISKKVSPYFSGTSVSTGWRLDEFAIKEYIDRKEIDRESLADMIKKSLMIMRSLKTKLRNSFNFLNYYYNNKDGKIFRYNFITGSLNKKLEEGKITQNEYNDFQEVKNSFIRMVNNFDSLGLEGFGPSGLSYHTILVIIFQTGKVIEFIYLRAMRYEELNSIREAVLRESEEELIRIQEAKRRYADI